LASVKDQDDKLSNVEASIDFDRKTFKFQKSYSIFGSKFPKGFCFPVPLEGQARARQKKAAPVSNRRGTFKIRHNQCRFFVYLGGKVSREKMTAAKTPKD
jgi:hypothetical protein